MASFQRHTTKNGTVSWRAQLFVNGIRDSKSGFTSKAHAKLWAAQREIEILAEAKQSNVVELFTPKITATTQSTIAPTLTFSLE